MRRHLALALALAATLVVACRPAESSRDTTSAAPPTAAVDTLRAELLRRHEEDQAARMALIERAKKEGLIGDSAAFARAAAPVAAIDSANRAWLRTAIARFGWPTKTMVGKEASSAAWLLVQHADQDTALQALALPLLEKAAAAGEAELSEVALLADRLAVARGELQEFGSQARTVDGRMVFFPIRDSATVDARRARVGLPPLAQYARMLDSLYGAASKAANP